MFSTVDCFFFCFVLKPSIILGLALRGFCTRPKQQRAELPAQLEMRTKAFNNKDRSR